MEGFDALFKHCSDAVLIYNPQTQQIINANESVCQLLRYTGDQMSFMDVNCILPKQLTKFKNFSKKVLRQGYAKSNEFYLKPRAGIKFPARLTAHLIKSETSLQILIFVKNSIKHKRAEEQLHESEKKYKILFNSGTDAIFVYHPFENDDEIHFIEVNDVACKQLGYTRNELLKMSPQGISLNASSEDMGARMEKLKTDSHILYEDLYLAKDGTRIPVEISSHLFEFNEKSTVMSIARDITARKRTQEQLRDQAALLDKSHDAIIVCDLNEYIIYWNKSAESLYGWQTEEILGNNASEMIFKKDADHFLTARRKVLEKGEWQGELSQITRTGNEITVESRWTLVHDNKGRAKSILIVNTDITEKKRIESQFLRAQRMESIGALAGGIAHDLNNVLAPILTAVQILQTKYKDEKSKRILNTIETNVTRGAEMIKQILTFARGIEGERIPLQIPHLLTELNKIISETFPKSIRLKLNVSSPLWTVLGDATQLQQVFLNLCVNSRDAMPAGGRMSISARNIILDKNFTRLYIDAKVGRYVLVKISDTGTGIPDNILDKIFEPFFTTKGMDKGTGLGLSTVLAIVRSHGGFVNVESELGKGTIFEIYLPALLEKETRQTEPTQNGLLFGNGEWVLVIDDETSILEISRETLENYGYSVLVAENGEEGIKIYRQNQEKISVVLTDMILPEMDGVNTIQALRKINPKIKIIASSGFLEDINMSDLLENEVEAFLYKPYTAEKLLTFISQVLDNNNKNLKKSEL